jgi:CRISPR-associated protein Cas1
MGEKVNARKILPSGLDGDILYVDTIGAYLGLSGQSIKVTAPGGNVIGRASLERLREVVLCGPVQSTSQVLHSCLKNSIPVHYMNLHGRYLGLCAPMHHFHGLLREAQWEAHFDAAESFFLAKATVKAKIANMKTIMMRYIREDRNAIDRENFKRMKGLIKSAENATDMDTLRGYEGMAGRIYFSQFERFIKPEKRSYFYFRKRNRRPPRDPVNALLSFGYSLLAKDCTGAGIRVGLDPYCGFYHTMK